MNFSLVIGVYGISGSGKSHSLALLKQKYKEWRCVEGSDVIARVMRERHDGTLEDFKRFGPEEQAEVRSASVRSLRNFRGVTIVAGHFSFPVVSVSGDGWSFDTVFSDEDKDLYDAILYLDVHPETVFNQRTSDMQDRKRVRDELSVDIIKDWIEHEKGNLPLHCKSFHICSENEALDQLISRVMTPHFEMHERASRDSIRAAVGRLPSTEVYLLIDGDRTITPQDTGRLFFDLAQRSTSLELGGDPLKEIFSRYSDYCFRPFFEVAMLYNHALAPEEYSAITHEFGSNLVHFHEEWVQFLKCLPSYVHPVLLSSSIRETWQAALSKYGLHDSMSVIAGNHIGLHDYLVDPQAKGIVAKQLRRNVPGCLILAFGDSPLDIPMLQAADRGYLVIDSQHPSESMQRYIKDCVASEDGRLYQLVFSTQVCFIEGLKVGSLTRLRRDLEERNLHTTFHFTDDPHARILATMSRRDDIRGLELQTVHTRIGRYLVSKLLQLAPDLVEGHVYRHVQQSEFVGLRTVGQRVAIVALMRGGEPMARGVYECFPEAQFFHYDEGHSTLEGIAADHIIVVDSVINSGSSIRRFLRLMELGTTCKEALPQIYVLTGVMQDLAKTLPKEYPHVRFLALRFSGNQYTGSGGTDTGNRLFGTLTSTT